MNKHETIADIVADIRDSVKQLDFDHPCMVEAGTLRKLAERIEAAMKREVGVSKTETTTEVVDIDGRCIMEVVDAKNATTTKESLQVGNSAKMREALKELRNRLVYFCARTDNRYSPPWVEELIGTINDALSAPARNIDCISTYEDMCKAWNNHVRTTHRTDVQSFFAWLFAEAKGENR